MARYTVTEIEDLARASAMMDDAASTIQRFNPQWAPAVVRCLAEAQRIIDLCRIRAASSLARALERNPQMSGGRDIGPVTAAILETYAPKAESSKGE
jgi:hypothetical protein